MKRPAKSRRYSAIRTGGALGGETNVNQKAILLSQLLASACLLAPLGAHAADAAVPTGDTGVRVEEIVVTAQRRSESLQQVPIAVSAVTGAELANRGLNDSLSLAASVPNLDISQNGTTLTLYLRGVGSNASDPNDESSVALYVDGVYIASPLANLFDYNNIDHVEVLKGPQGTLFGRNATGGVIQVVTRDPSHTPGGQISATYGDYNTVGASVYATTGLGPNLAADIAAVYHNNIDGYGFDIFRHQPIMRREDFGVRAKILWTPTPKTSVRLSADYSTVRSDGTPYQLAPGVIGADGVTTYPGPYRTDTNETNLGNTDVWGLSARLEQDFDVARFVSISAYRHIVGLYDLDEDSTPAPIVNSFIHQLARNFSQEIQLLSPQGSRLQWVVGGYYFNATYAYDPITIGGFAAGGPNASEDIFGIQTTHSYSAYGQATYEILPGTKLTAGLRYTDENQNDHAFVQIGGVTVVAPPDQHQSFNKLTWRLALDHKFGEDVLGYVSYNRGIKSGGFNLLGPGAPGYKPEVLDAYEIGLKSEFFNHMARINVAAFYYDYQDIQVQNIEAGAVNTVNAASAKMKGFDADLVFVPVHNLTVSSSVGYTYGTYSNFKNATFTPPSPLDGPQFPGDASGNQIINTPRWTVSGSLDYRIPTQVGDFLFDLTGAYKSSTFVSADNRLTIPAHTVFNTAVGWTEPGGKYGVQLWVHNMFDERYYASRTETSVGDLQYLAPPLTFGVTVNTKF
jgi:iron complex outermembrane receptor protein